jgi:galactose-1-phosphate uridylyltransferase
MFINRRQKHNPHVTRELFLICPFPYMVMAITYTLSNILDTYFTYVMMTHRASETEPSFFVHFTICVCMLFEADNKLQGLNLLKDYIKEQGYDFD